MVSLAAILLALALAILFSTVVFYHGGFFHQARQEAATARTDEATVGLSYPVMSLEAASTPQGQWIDWTWRRPPQVYERVPLAIADYSRVFWAPVPLDYWRPGRVPFLNDWVEIHAGRGGLRIPPLYLYQSPPAGVVPFQDPGLDNDLSTIQYDNREVGLGMRPQPVLRAPTSPVTEPTVASMFNAGLITVFGKLWRRRRTARKP